MGGRSRANTRGRPPATHPLSSVVNVRFECAQRRAIARARMLTGEGQSEFIRRAVLDTAQLILLNAERRCVTAPSGGE